MFVIAFRGVFCPIVGCGARLTCLEDFEDHYNARHTASCSVCSRVYPTSRLLSIHVSEAHSSFFQAKVARGDPMVFPVFVLLCWYCLRNDHAMFSVFPIDMSCFFLTFPAAKLGSNLNLH